MKVTKINFRKWGRNGKLRVCVSCLITTWVFALPSESLAHNKVVVIPLAGDNVELLPAPLQRIAPAAPTNANYVISLSTVLDRTTGLEWQRASDDTLRNWDTAQVYCRDLELAGKNDWRLPLPSELQSIIDYSRFDPAINLAVFPATESGFYWTSFNYALGSTSAWSVDFQSGVLNRFLKVVARYVRCVRQ